MARTKAFGTQVKSDGDSVQTDTSFQLEMRKARDESSDPGSPVSGEIWNNTTQDITKINQAEGIGTVVRCIFANVDPTAQIGASSIVEADFASQAQFTFPVNSLKEDQHFRIQIRGRYSSNAAATIRFRCYLGAITLGDTGGLTTANASTRTFCTEIKFKVVAAGSGGTVTSGMTFQHQLSSTTGDTQSSSAIAAACDTTATKLVKCSWLFSVSDPANFAEIQQITIERLR